MQSWRFNLKTIEKMTTEQLFMLLHGPEDNALMPSIVIEIEDQGGFNVSEFTVTDSLFLVVQCEEGPLVEISKDDIENFVVQSDKTITGVDCLGRRVKFFINAAFVEDWAD